MDGINLNDFPGIPEMARQDLEKKLRGAVQLEDGVSRMVVKEHDGGIAYRFFIHSEYNKIKSDAAGYEVFDEIEMIQWFVDRRTKPVERVQFLPEGLLSFNRFGECVGGKYRDAYMRFKEGRETEGTPLVHLGMLSEGEIASLTAESIYTIEQFAAMPEDRVIGRFPQEFVDAYERAKQQVAGRDMSAAQEQQIERMVELEKANSSLQARLEELEANSEHVDTVRRVLDETPEETEEKDES